MDVPVVRREKIEHVGTTPQEILIEGAPEARNLDSVTAEGGVVNVRNGVDCGPIQAEDAVSASLSCTSPSAIVLWRTISREMVSRARLSMKTGFLCHATAMRWQGCTGARSADI
jgi:hypothetical protein